MPTNTRKVIVNEVTIVNQRFPRVFRIRKQADFDRAFSNDAFAADAVLVVRGAVNDLSCSRLGLSVSRRVGKAVARNRWKRLIREAFRQQRERLPAGFDFVVRPRRGADPDFHAIQRSLPRLCEQLARRLTRSR